MWRHNRCRYKIYSSVSSSIQICKHHAQGTSGTLGYEGFYDDNNEGTDEGYFKDCISDYVWQHHQHDDDSLDDGLDVPIFEQVKMILKELNV